jgi:hypothetical protein
MTDEEIITKIGEAVHLGEKGTSNVAGNLVLDYKILGKGYRDIRVVINELSGEIITAFPLKNLEVI